MDQQVKAGKLTQAQADQALAVMEKFAGPTMLMVFGCAGAVFGSFAHIFWWAFVLWLMAQWFLKKPRFLFSRPPRSPGLTTMILVLGTVVTILLTVITGKLGMTPSLALTLGEFDLKNRMHLLLAAVNIFSFWQIGVAACGLACD